MDEAGPRDTDRATAWGRGADGAVRLEEGVSVDPVAGRDLLKHTEDILVRWESKVREACSPSAALNHPVLVGQLGFLLAHVARLVSGGSVDVPPASVSAEHGAQRAALQQYTLRDVFLEFRLLREAVLEVLAQGGPVSQAVQDAVRNALDDAMQEAGAQYAVQQMKVEKARGDQARAAYDRERHIANILQRPLLLKVPEDCFPGVSVATLYEPLSGEAQAGGDFIDAFSVGQGKVALVVGDAAGKGLEVAVHNTYARDVLRALLRAEPDHPGLVLRRLNTAVFDTLLLDRLESSPEFIAVSLAVLDPARAVVVSASAGMELPRLIRTARNAIEPAGPASGLPLGIQADQSYEDSSVQMERDDILVMVSDGISEAGSGGNLFGGDRLVEVVPTFPQTSSLYAIAHAIFSQACTFGGGQFRDDASLVMARLRAA